MAGLGADLVGDVVAAEGAGGGHKDDDGEVEAAAAGHDPAAMTAVSLGMIGMIESSEREEEDERIGPPGVGDEVDAASRASWWARLEGRTYGTGLPLLYPVGRTYVSGRCRSSSSPTSGSGPALRHEQHRRVHVRRLDEGQAGAREVERAAAVRQRVHAVGGASARP